MSFTARQKGNITGLSALYHISLRDLCFFFFSSRRRHTRLQGDWSSDVCSSDLEIQFGEVLMSSYVDMHPLLGMDSLPFIVRGFDEAARLWQLTRPVLQEFLLAQQGVRLLFAVPWPAQGLFCRRPVNSIVDLKGLRLRVQSDATKRLAELWGAQPVVLAAGDLGMVRSEERRVGE